MCIDLSDYNRNLNQIWDRTHVPHYQHAGMAKFTQMKIQDGGCRHPEFLQNVSISGLDIDILHQIIWEDASRPCRDDHMTKSRNQKLIPVMT